MLSKTEAYPLSTTDKRQNLPIIQPHAEGKAGYHFLILLSEVSNHCSASAIPTVQLMSQQQFCLSSCTVITLPKIFSSVKWNWTLYKIIARSFFNDFFFKNCHFMANLQIISDRCLIQKRHFHKWAVSYQY